jgi:hypothetical protein
MATYTPRRVKDEEERGQYSSEYIQLDKGEKFIGYALFQGDPKETEDGYYEYWEHYDPGLGKRGQSVPCAGDVCPYCEDGDKPRNRAKSAWSVTQIGDKKLKAPEFRTFTMGPQLIRQMSELRQEGDKIKGRLFRVSRPEEKEYVLAPKTETLKVAEVKEALKACPDFLKGVTNTLKRAMERTLMARALSDDEPDAGASARRDNGDGEEPAKGKDKGKDKEEPTQEAVEWPDSLEDEEVVVTEVESNGNYFEATSMSYEGTKNVYTTKGIEFDLSDLAEGQIVTVSATLDGDGDYILDAEPSAEAPAVKEEGEEGSTLPDKIEDEVFAVTEINGEQQTMDVENDELGLAFTLYFLDKGPGSDTDLDEYSEGDKIKVTAEKDTEGDMVATVVPEKVTGKKKGAAPAKKGK